MNVNSAVNEYPYVVVEFLQLPYANIDEYVCIPRSWIRVRRPTDRKSIVAFPNEPSSITKMRIMNCDEPSEKWEHYLAIVKVEKRCYEDAYQYIMEKIHNASSNRYSAVIKNSYKRVPATATKQYSPKIIDLSNPQSKKNRNKLNVVDEVRQSDTISNPSKGSEHCNLELRTLTSSKPTGFFSSENTVIEENCKKEHHNLPSRDVRSSSDDLLLRYPYILQKPEKNEESQVNSLEGGSRRRRKTLYASKCPIKKICNYTLNPEENQLSSIHHEHLHNIALTQGIPDNKILNIQTFTLDLPEPLIRDPNIGSNTSFAIQNPTNEANQFRQQEILESSPVIPEHLQVLPNQETPYHSSEEECATSELTAHSQMTSASHASITCRNSAEHQDSIVEDMVVNELTEVSCLEQNVFSGTTAENEYSVNPKALEEANHSEQSLRFVESSMVEGLPIVETVTSSKISTTQDVDDDEQINSSELSSDEIITTNPNSHKPAKQSVLYVLDKADVWADQLFDLFQKMKINFSETCHVAHELHESLLETQKVIECMANASENLRAFAKGEVAVVTSKDVTTEIQQTAEVNQAEKKEEESPDVNMEEDKKKGNDVDSKRGKNYNDSGGDTKDAKHQDGDNEFLKTTRGHIRAFVLPPEYDPHDTKWTLKYRKSNPELNLVELVPGSNVFINSIKLAHCIRSARDSKALARKLLEEIFTQSALSVCSLTGARANAFNISGTNVRPGLDANARIAISTFVEEHAREKKWATFDSQSVDNTLRSKIQEIRAKHAKTT